MELLPLIYKALLYFSIATVVILIFSYVTYKVKQKKMGNLKPHEKFQKAKEVSESKTTTTPKVEKVERAETVPEKKTDIKHEERREETNRPSKPDERRYQPNKRPPSRIQRIERIVNKIEKHRPPEDSNDSYERRKSVPPPKDQKRLEIIKPKAKPANEQKPEKKKNHEDISKMKSLGDNVLQNYSEDDEDLNYTVKVDKNKSGDTEES